MFYRNPPKATARDGNTNHLKHSSDPSKSLYSDNVSRLFKIFAILVIFVTFGTLTVSASTLNVGEGQQYANIQDAVNASQIDDVILLSAGSYDDNVVLTNCIKLKGESYSTTILNGDINCDGVSNVEISDLTLHNVVFSNGAYNTISSCYFNSGKIDANAVKGLTVNNCQFVSSAITLTNSVNYHIYDCLFSMTSGYGITSSSGHGEVNKCTFFGQGVSAIALSGDVKSTNIHNNLFKPALVGISGSSATTGDVFVTDNMYCDTLSDGFKCLDMGNIKGSPDANNADSGFGYGAYSPYPDKSAVQAVSIIPMSDAQPVSNSSRSTTIILTVVGVLGVIFVGLKMEGLL